MDVPTGLVDMYELADALRVLGKSERDIQQLLKELVPPTPQPYFHDVDAPVVGSKVSVPKLRKAPDVRDQSYFCVGTAHSALGTAEVAASSDTVRPKNVSSQVRRRSRLR